MNKTNSFFINIWLVSLMTIILLMIIVGGLTRLTESGLSMVDWRLFMGTIPPLSQADWLKVFEDYKQYPEYQIKNINMTLSEFKYIFWWEYGHRVLGRLIGIVFIIPFAYFALKKYFSIKFLIVISICQNINVLLFFICEFDQIYSPIDTEIHISLNFSFSLAAALQALGRRF